MKPYISFFSVPNINLPHINPIMGGKQQCSSGYTFGPVMRQYYIIEYVIKGHGVYTTRGQRYEVKAGEAFIIRPYEQHILQADEKNPWEHIWLVFETDLQLPKILQENDVFNAENG
jgi:gentisate 1,2-dioxygenase